MNKYLATLIIGVSISLIGIFYYTIQSRRIIEMPHMPTSKELMKKTNYRALTYLYALGTFVVLSFYWKLKMFSGLIAFIVLILLDIIPVLWTHIRMKHSRLPKKLFISSDDVKDVAEVPVEFPPLPVWIDISFVIGSILLTTLTLYLFSK